MFPYNYHLFTAIHATLRCMWSKRRTNTTCGKFLTSSSLSTQMVKLNLKTYICNTSTLPPDSDESEDDADTEVWECKKEGCIAKIEVNKDNVLVGHNGQHSCDTILMMQINRDCAHLGEFKFQKESSIQVRHRSQLENNMFEHLFSGITRCPVPCGTPHVPV